MVTDAQRTHLDSVIRLIPGYDPVATAAGATFDYDAAQRALDWFPECLKHVKGEKAGQPFVLELWQQAIIANLFGWMQVDDHGRTVRRYRKLFLMVARKNGKTPMEAGILLYCLLCDGEGGAEIYAAASDSEQASLVYEHATGMIDQNPILQEQCQVYHSMKSIEVRASHSYLRVLTAQDKTKHGKNAHCVGIDELHVTERKLVEVMETSVSARAQPFILYFTTQDYSRPSVCNDRYKMAASVRDNGGDPAKPGYDQRFLPAIYECDQKDDWRDEKIWIKANPNLGVSKSIEYMREACHTAQEDPSYENVFKRLDLNIRTEQAERIVPMAEYDVCPSKLDVADLARCPCHGAIDLASVADLAALAFVFQLPGDRFAAIVKYFCPKDTAERRQDRDKVPYLTWAKQGWIELTPGNRTDYRFIRQRVNELGKQFHVIDIGYDPWNASHLCGTELGEEDGFKMVEFRQGGISMNEPFKRLLGLIKGGEFNHGGNPVLRWNFANLASSRDPHDNIAPDKKRSADKIDGAVAVIMALGRAMAGGAVKSSVYETRGVRRLGERPA